MHRALIVPSQYDLSSGYPDRPGWQASALALANRLKERGYDVDVLTPGAGLVRNLRQALATEDPLSAVVVVFSGYVLLTESNEPALLLCDEQVIALRVEQLAGKASRTFGRVLLVLDAARGSSTRVVQDAATQQAHGKADDASPEQLLAQMALHSINGENIGALVRVAPWALPEGAADVGLCETLDRVLLGLEDAQAVSTPQLEQDLVQRLSPEGGAFECKHSKPAFIFLPARRFASEPPKAQLKSEKPSELGKPPPLPSERAAPPPLPSERAAPPPLPSEQPAPPPLPSEQPAPPPLPSEQPAPPPLPSEQPAPPPLPSEQPTPSPLPEEQSAPPPLPSEQPAPSPLPSEQPAPSPLPSEQPTPSPLPEEQSAPPPLPEQPPPEQPTPPVTDEQPLPEQPAPDEQPAPPPPLPEQPLPEQPAPPPPLPDEQPAPPPPLPEQPPPEQPPAPPPLPDEQPAPPPPLPDEQPAPPPPLPEQPAPPPPLPEQPRPEQPPAPPPLPDEQPPAPPPLPEQPAPPPPLPEQPPPEQPPAPPPLPDEQPPAPTPLPDEQPAPPPVPDEQPAPPHPAPDRQPPRFSEEPRPAPPVLSPDSWRPRAGSTEPARDEAALLSHIQECLRSGDNDAALVAAKSCLQSFPESVQAMQVAATLLVQDERLEELAALYDEVISILAPNPAASQLCAAAARLWAGQLGDPVRARRSLEAGLHLDANNSSLHREMADLLEASGDPAGAAHHTVRALQLNPMSVQLAKTALPRLRNGGHVERAFTTACLLSFAGQADASATDTIAAHRNPTLPRPNRGLDVTDYSFGLDVASHDPSLARVLTLLEPAARRVQLPKPKQQRLLVESLRKESVEQSTTMLARTFGWTCRLLSLGTPALFMSDGDALPSLLPVETASFAVGKSLGRGLSLSELVFLWGRSLGLSRPQTRIVYSYPSQNELLTLVLAGRVAAGMEAGTNPEVKRLSKLLKKHVDNGAWPQLAEALGQINGDLFGRVQFWKQQVDGVANRIGLIACGDPELAARTLDRFPAGDATPRKQQLSELMSFALSDDYAELRRRLGLHLG